MSETRREFWTAEGFSQSTYYELRKQGLGPHEEYIPGTSLIRVVESHDDWRARIAALADSKAVRLETERRRQRAIVAARASVAARAAKKQQHAKGKLEPPSRHRRSEAST